MVQRLLGKLRRAFRLLVISRKTFSPPSRSAMLIYDGERSAHLLRVLQPITAEILFTRGEALNVAVLLKAMLRKGRLSDAYEDCYIEFVKPRVIITWIDNTPRFYRLAQRHPGVRTIFVQNGWRGGVDDIFHTLLRHLPAQGEPYHVDIMCTYGGAIGAEYRKYISGKSIAIGSILSNEYPVAAKGKIRRLAYISTFAPGVRPDTKHAVEFVLKELARYSVARGVPLAVVGKSNFYRESEERYYRDLLGGKAEFLRREGQHSSYRYLDESEVSVSIDTSLGYETVARGNKNAFFSILGYYYGTYEYNFGWPENYPDEGPFWTNRPDPEAFDRTLDHLFEIDDARWRQELAAANYSSLVVYDPGNSNIKSILAKELDLAPVA